jgi:hypothetical protein
MDRQILNYLIDAGLAVTFIISLATGLLKFPGVPGYMGSLGLVLPYAFFTVLHDWSSLLLGLLVAAHLSLHCRWLLSMTRQVLFRRGRKA